MVPSRGVAEYERTYDQHNGNGNYNHLHANSNDLYRAPKKEQVFIPATVKLRPPMKKGLFGRPKKESPATAKVIRPLNPMDMFPENPRKNHLDHFPDNPMQVNPRNNYLDHFPHNPMQVNPRNPLDVFPDNPMQVNPRTKNASLPPLEPPPLMHPLMRARTSFEPTSASMSHSTDQGLPRRRKSVEPPNASTDRDAGRRQPLDLMNASDQGLRRRAPGASDSGHRQRPLDPMNASDQGLRRSAPPGDSESGHRQQPLDPMNASDQGLRRSAPPVGSDRGRRQRPLDPMNASDQGLRRSASPGDSDRGRRQRPLDPVNASDHGPRRRMTTDASDSGRRRPGRRTTSDTADQGRQGRRARRATTAATNTPPPLDQGLGPVSDSNHEPLETPTASSHDDNTAIQTVLEIFPNVNPERARQLHREGKSTRTMISIFAEESRLHSTRVMGMMERELEFDDDDDDDVSLGEEILPFGQYHQDEEVVPNVPLAPEELGESQGSLRMQTIREFLPFADSIRAKELLLEHSLGSVMEILADELSNDGQNEEYE
jgi:hypothetical protein